MLNNIISFFNVLDEGSPVDNFTLYEHSFKASLNIEKLSQFNEAEYSRVNEYIVGFGYNWNLEIEELSYAISQNKYEDIDFIGFVDNDPITVVLNIFKKGNKVVIFEEQKFSEFINSESLIDILNYFKGKNEGVEFLNSHNQFISANSYLGFNKALKTEKRSEIKLSSQCNFTNYSDFKYSPEDFFLAESPKNTSLLLLFEKLQFVFILIHIFDNTEIKNNKIDAIISGYKTLRYSLDFNALNIDSIKIYKRIFDWIYSEKNKVEDKLGIARNIISMYLDGVSIDLEPDTFSSILSANNTYIKGNINKYIDMRNKVHSQLEQVSNSVNKSLEVFFSNFQKSIFVFISFYLSIFIFRTYRKEDLVKVFDRETTIMALGLLFLSFCFLIFSNWVLNLEENRINKKYQDIKRRALDILVKDDVDKVLNKDTEFNEEIVFLNKRRWLYIKLWGLALGVFLVVLKLTSSYL